MAYVTPKPSLSPIPAPTTSVPSAAPSMTGLVASFVVSKPVTTSLSNQEYEELLEEVASNFNVDPSEVDATCKSLFSLS